MGVGFSLCLGAKWWEQGGGGAFLKIRCWFNPLECIPPLQGSSQESGIHGWWEKGRRGGSLLEVVRQVLFQLRGSSSGSVEGVWSRGSVCLCARTCMCTRGCEGSSLCSGCSLRFGCHTQSTWSQTHSLTLSGSAFSLEKSFFEKKILEAFQSTVTRNVLRGENTAMPPKGRPDA